ncbi:MAG: class I SAM-dependent methyltransferase [Clostridiales bacterium]|jgi:ubiquinone/menaquinone biosynthesis C-methylase UbiE|nr:class I SAM-dependent methyltransferase [Clostridiales bacterium]
MNNFGILAAGYDKYNTADYDKYAAFVKDAFSLSAIPVKEVLDLGCGTGEMAVRLADMGYSVTALDISAEMLSVLTDKIKGRDILPVFQDMINIDLYGTVAGCISAFDSLNYLLNAKDLEKAFAGVGKFMEKGGVFVFDINTSYAYEKVYADNSYVYETENSMLVWRNCYNRNTRKCHFYLTEFELSDDGRYFRTDAVHVQKNHSLRTIKTAADKAGFDVMGIYGNTDRGELENTSPKAYYVLRKNREL